MDKALYFLVLLSIIITNGNFVKSRQGKITGGVPADPQEFPYVVSIRSNLYGHTCGGALLSPFLVVTAAICVPQTLPNYEIVAGTLNKAEAYEGQQIRFGSRGIVHPDFGGISPINDIGLIFFEEPFVFNENISAIALPEANRSTFPGEVLTCGWGNEQYGLPLSDVLMKTTMNTYSDALCEEWMGLEIPGVTVPKELLCLGTNVGGHSSCQGDAGAPVVSTTEDIYLAGITSHFPCTRPIEECCGVPGPIDHCPELTYYLDWIKEQSAKYGGGL